MLGSVRIGEWFGNFCLIFLFYRGVLRFRKRTICLTLLVSCVVVEGINVRVGLVGLGFIFVFYELCDFG